MGADPYKEILNSPINWNNAECIMFIENVAFTAKILKFVASGHIYLSFFVSHFAFKLRDTRI